MKGLDSVRDKDKVKKICELLTKETLEPAQLKAQEIIEMAQKRAQELLIEAQKQAEKLLLVAREQIEQRKAVFEASLAQACRQTIEFLKEKVENKLFNEQLSELLTKPLQDAKVVSRIIEAVIHAVEKEGLNASLSVAISSAVSAREVNQLLAKNIVEKLREKGVLLSSIGGGIELKILDEHVTIDLSDAAFKELVASYIRKDFRDLIFAKS